MPGLLNSSLGRRRGYVDANYLYCEFYDGWGDLQDSGLLGEMILSRLNGLASFNMVFLGRVQQACYLELRKFVDRLSECDSSARGQLEKRHYYEVLTYENGQAVSIKAIPKIPNSNLISYIAFGRAVFRPSSRETVTGFILCKTRPGQSLPDSIRFPTATPDPYNMRCPSGLIDTRN